MSARPWLAVAGAAAVIGGFLGATINLAAAQWGRMIIKPVAGGGPSPTVIARAGTVTGYTTAAATLSNDWSYVIATPTGSNAALIVLEARWTSSGAPNISTVVVDPAGANIACSQIGVGLQSASGATKSSAWYCPVGGITGTKIVRVTYATTAPSAQGGCVMEYSGVGQTLALGVEGAATTPVATIQTSVTTVVNVATLGDWLMGFPLPDTDTFNTPTAPMTLRNPPAAPTSCAGTATNVTGGAGMDSNGAVISTGNNNVTANFPTAAVWQHAWAIKHG